MNYNDENFLDMVELYADSQGFIASEDDLSEKFDNEIMPSLIEHYGKKGELFDDETMMNEEFNNWSDSLCKDGEIHPLQYDNYCYVGKHK